MKNELHTQTIVDRAGVIASAVCAVHCAICALLPSLLVFLGLGALLSHEAEWGFSLLAVGLAAIALARGWRHHRSFAIALLFSAGIAGLLASRFLEENAELVGTTVGVFAAIVLISGHFMNLRSLREAHRKPHASSTL